MSREDPTLRSSSLLPLIQRTLAATPRLSASEIARRLGCDRGEVMRTIDANPRQFVRVAGDHWCLAADDGVVTDALGDPPGSEGGTDGTNTRHAGDSPTPLEVGSSETAGVAPRRPGPFGPARDLVAPDARIEMVSVDTPVSTAIEVMSEKGLTQVFVRGVDARLAGVFSWQQFSLRSHALRQLNRPFSEVLGSAVEQFMRELRPQDFISPDQYIDTDVEWMKNDFVIVGTRDHALGVLTIVDVWAILNDFAEAFVLLHEIELTLRDLVVAVGAAQVQTWLDTMRIPDNAARPNRLEDLTLRQYATIICQREHRWPLFAAPLACTPELFEADLINIVRIRNEVMHFKSKANQTMCRHLQQFRDRLRTALRRARG